MLLRKRDDASPVLEAVVRFEALELICAQLEDQAEELRNTQAPGR